MKKRQDIDDRATRDAVLQLMREEQDQRRYRDSLCLRGKQCPIQRPMLDRWPES